MHPASVHTADHAHEERRGRRHVVAGGHRGAVRRSAAAWPFGGSQGPGGSL